MYLGDPVEEEKKLQRKRAAERKTLNVIVDLLISNLFTTHDLLVLIKYLLDHHPYPLDKIPPAYLEMLEGKDSTQKR